MKLRMLLVGAAAVVLTASSAIAAPPPGKGKPETAGKPATAGKPLPKGTDVQAESDRGAQGRDHERVCQFARHGRGPVEPLGPRVGDSRHSDGGARRRHHEGSPQR